MQWGVATICCALLAVVALAIVGCHADDAAFNAETATAGQTPQFKWKMTTFASSDDSRYSVNLTHFAAMVKEATQGRIEVELFPSGSIVPNEEIPSAVRSGAVQIAHSVGSYWSGVMPVGTVEFYMPRSFLTPEDTWTLMWDRGLQDLLREAYAEQNVYMLTFEVATGSFLMTKDKVPSVQGLRGLKIRATGTAGDFMARLGASPTNTNMSELHLGIENGTVDGAVLGYEQCEALRLQEVCSYMAYPGLFLAQPLDILINKDAWDALPEDLKTIMELVGRDFSIWSGMVQQPKDRERSTAAFEAAGVKFVQFSDSDIEVLQRTAMDLWDEWAKKDEYCRRAVEIYKAYAGEHGR